VHGAICRGLGRLKEEDVLRRGIKTYTISAGGENQNAFLFKKEKPKEGSGKEAAKEKGLCRNLGAEKNNEWLAKEKYLAVEGMVIAGRWLMTLQERKFSERGSLLVKSGEGGSK